MTNQQRWIILDYLELRADSAKEAAVHSIECGAPNAAQVHTTEVRVCQDTIALIDSLSGSGSRRPGSWAEHKGAADE